MLVVFPVLVNIVELHLGAVMVRSTSMPDQTQSKAVFAYYSKLHNSCSFL